MECSVRVAVSGAGGFIGSALVARLERRGDSVVRMVRRPVRGPAEASWDPETGAIDAGALSGIDAAVHLAGESIAAGPWTAAKRRRIRDSRVRGTGLLATTLARLTPPPRVLVSGSAMGIYGDRGDAPLTEDAAPGAGFLAEVCTAWEAAADPARAAGIRVAHPRLALVLDPAGGVLGRLVPVFRLGLGGPIGDGRQWWSWVTRDDVIGALVRMIDDASLAGPFNVAAPGAMTNEAFTRTLARALRRPAWLRAPAWALRLVLGAMADEGLLASARLVPARLAAAGHAFRDPELAPTLARLLDG